MFSRPFVNYLLKDIKYKKIQSQLNIGHDTPAKGHQRLNEILDSIPTTIFVKIKKISWVNSIFKAIRQNYI